MPHDATFYRQLFSAPWLAWGLYWVVSAARNKATQRRESLGSRLTHVVPLIVGGVLLAGQRLPWGALALRLWPQTLLSFAPGFALLLAGLGFSVWARVHLGRNWSGTVTVKEGHELIRSGPYAYVRHPIYTGLLTAMLGTAIASGTLAAALGLAIIAAALVRKMRTEEAFMRETFPGEYQRYSVEVPALVPFTAARRSARR
jgi:protein-S-isoprenylcysteine O-methyltransferase Ste14